MSSGSQLFLVDETLADEVLRDGRKRLRNVWQLLHLQLLNEMVQVLDSVPGVLRRGQLNEGAAERPDVTSASDWLACEALWCHPKDAALEFIEDCA